MLVNVLLIAIICRGGSTQFSTNAQVDGAATFSPKSFASSGVGGAIGGVIVGMVLVGTVILLAVLIVVRYRRTQKGSGPISISNDLYGKGLLTVETTLKGV